ncbi:hypothetical protein HYFRA_00012684 [Hymenoscyphus fraxineus]|uniref:Gastric mucin-like protein n=1 Tax=Hymenoscyphus fraxineus TaxID=746836 RepID=A0A9N9LAJ4_9HELO|nr:hypothetical protein HYFRA_00012684 [Hymenoscyphus fraxineus]
MEVNSLAKHHGGSLVALEGDVETISTQLRLLPPSKKILIIPSLIESIEQEPLQQPFNARAFIRKVHIAIKKHTDTARSFLESSTNKHPKLAFMNGGTVCARATCILQISKHITNGDSYAAEKIFNKITRYGLASLFEEEDTIGEETDEDGPGDVGDARVEEQKIIAETAGSLKRTISQIQVHGSRGQHGVESDLYPVNGDGVSLNEVSPLSKSSRSYRGSDGVSSMTQSNNSIRGSTEVPSLTQSKRNNRDSLSETEALHSPFKDEPFFMAAMTAKSRRVIARRHSFNARDSRYPSRHLYAGDLEKDDTSPPLASPIDVTFGEACLVDVTPEKQLKRVHSVDRFCTESPRSVEKSLATMKLTEPIEFNKSRRTSAAVLEGWGTQPLPKKKFVKASTTTIKRYPGSVRSITPKLIQVSKVSETPDSCTRNTVKQKIAKKICNLDYEPIFPVEEDLVIHFNNTEINEHNHTIDSIIRSYKDGSYPTLPPSAKLASSTVSLKSIAIHDATDRMGVKDSHSDGDAIFTVEFEDEIPESEDDYDDFSQSCSRQLWPTRKTGRSDSGVQMPDFQPSPEIIASPPNGRAERFVELFAADLTSPLFLQDALRKLLSVHFPAGDDGFSQNYFAISPESDRLWKPVFRNDRDPNNKGKTIDQIIALGSEAGVPEEFLGQISGRIENLDARKDGISRSSELDITYLISNVLQNYRDTPFTSQGTFNPLSDPQVLAALLVPQLEAYLASNKRIQLLILRFTPIHFATVLSLRLLLGMDIFRVAGVLNSRTHDHPPCASESSAGISRGNSTSIVADLVVSRIRQRHSKAESLRILNMNQSKPTADLESAKQGLKASDTENAVSFAEANHLLPCTANDSEIASFIAGIWKALQQDSPSIYVFEPDLEIMIVERLLAPSPINIPKIYNPPPTSQLPPIPKLSRNSSTVSLTPSLGGRSRSRGPRESSPLAKRATSCYTDTPNRNLANAKKPRDSSVSSFSRSGREELDTDTTDVDTTPTVSVYAYNRPEAPTPTRGNKNRKSSAALPLERSPSPNRSTITLDSSSAATPRASSPSYRASKIEFDDIDISELSHLQTFFNPTPPLPPLESPPKNNNDRSQAPSPEPSYSHFPFLQNEFIDPNTFEKTSLRNSNTTRSRVASSCIMPTPSKLHRVTASTIGKYASSIKSSKTGKSRASRVQNADGGWETFYISDVDSEDDEFDRMILGRKHARIVPEVRKEEGEAKKRDKSKALKFLGLA